VSTQPQLEKFVFVAGRIESASKAVFVAHYLPALQDKVYVAVVLIWESDQWQRLGKFPWQAVDIELDPAGPARYWVLGRDGQIASMAGEAMSEDVLDRKRPLGPMRGLNLVESDVFAVGMKRDVFRARGHAWRRFDKGMAFEIPKNADVETVMKKRLSDVGGINAVAGFSALELYAVGVKGEMWQTVDDQWVKVDSPTNVMLTDATIVGEEVVACGLAGTVVRGRGASWRVVEYEGVQGLDFSSITSRGDEIYLADGHSLRLLRGTALELVNLAPDAVVPSSQLDARQRLVLSVAGQEVFMGTAADDWRSLL